MKFAERRKHRFVRTLENFPLDDHVLPVRGERLGDVATTPGELDGTADLRGFVFCHFIALFAEPLREPGYFETDARRRSPEVYRDGSRPRGRHYLALIYFTVVPAGLEDKAALITVETRPRCK